MLAVVGFASAQNMGMMCPGSPMQMCRMMCPPVICPAGQCAMRRGNCCSVSCQPMTNDDDSNRIMIDPGFSVTPRHPIDPLPPPPAPSSNKPPVGCAQWFDGCNTCHRNSATGPMMCTMMMCFAPGKSMCKSYLPGYGSGPVTSSGVSSGSGVGARCAAGFCENPADCPKCSNGLKCHVNPGMMCAGTCYGTCVETDEQEMDGHRRTQFLGGNGGMRLAGGADLNADADAVNCCGGGGACGYVHCPALGAGTEGCVRPWMMPNGMSMDDCAVEKTASTTVATTAMVRAPMCEGSPMQMCRMMCPPTMCPAGQCAMRQGNCCNVRCQTEGH